MEQTSKLSIVVDTRDAQTKIRQFTTDLKNIERYSKQANQALKNITNGVNFTQLNAGLNSVNTNLIRFNNTAGQSSSRMQNLGSTLNSLRSNMASMATATNNINAIFGNLDRTMDRLAAATNNLNAATIRANDQINRLGANSNRANGQARGLMGTLQGLQGVLAGGLFAVTGLGILKTADEMQNLNSQIKLVTNSTGEFLGVREKVREIADRNYNDIAATTNLYQKSATALANLGKSQQEALIFTDAVSLAMRTGGRSAQEQASAILQLGQAMGSGVLMGDEFRSIAENAPILLELVSRRMGVLPGQLKELASEGKITSEIMYDAFSQNISMLEEMAKKMPLTMSQAFVVAKNDYKKFVDGMMNDTGGASSKIAGFITGVSGNFETLAKVAIAGVGLAFAQMALSIGSASTAMAIFNAVAGLNPLVLIAGGFLAVNSAIYGTNDVLSISGIVMGDFFDAMGVMLGDAETGWNDFSDTVARAMGRTVDEVADANDKNAKNFLGLYEQTEKGFAGVVQGISSSVAAVTAVFGTFFEVMARWIDNTILFFDNMGKAAYNAGNAVKVFFGGEDKNVEYGTGYKNTNAFDIYSATNASNQSSIRDYARSLNDRAGVSDPTYKNALRSSVFNGNVTFNSLTSAGSGVLLPKPKGLPDNLRAPNSQISNLPMSLIKEAQYKELKAQEAIAAAKEESEKEAKKRAKLEKGLTDRLVGISGDTGVGNAHLHIQYRDKSRPVSPADLARFKAGEKRITDYPMTSGYGKRNTGIKGASTNHKGTDFGIPKNTPITTNVAVKNVKTWNDPKGGGYVSTITFEDGVVIDLLHQMPSVMGVEKGSSTGNKKIDSMVSKAESEVAKAAAKAERERIKAAEEAQKEQDRIANLRLKLIKDYGDKQLQLEIENDARVAEIKDAGFNSTKQAELIEQSKQQMDRELAVYKKGLDDRVSELVKFQQTERDLLKKQYDDNVFSLVSDNELSRPENSERLKQAIINAKALYDYNVSMYESALEQQKDAMYAFQKTERQILLDGWDNKLADAENQYDELRDYRISALVAEGRQEISIFDTNQSLKMLELRKSHMSAMQYIKERYALEQQLIGLSNEPDDVKALQLEALRDPTKVALKDMLGGIEQQSPMARIQAEYEANLLIIEEYEQKYTDMIGVQTEARLAVEQSYMNAKRDLMLGTSQEIFGNMAGLAKAFAGEQSGIYRAMFAVEKGIALARTLLAAKTAMALAWASAPFPYNLGAVATAAVETGVLSAAVGAINPKGFKQGGYTGNMGASQVAGVVHGQEYVFDAQATKRIGVDNLNAMRSGKAPAGGGGDININVNVDAKGNASLSGDNDKMGRQMAQGIKAVVLDTIRKEKRQGGMLHA